jgi:hypothetical protein
MAVLLGSAKSTKMTAYEAWNKGIRKGYGSFHTALLEAYRLADNENRKKLEKGFKEWFVKKIDI